MKLKIKLASIVLLSTVGFASHATSSYLPAAKVEIKSCSVSQEGSKNFLTVRHQGWTSNNKPGYVHHLDFKVEINDDNYGNIYRLKDLGTHENTYDQTKVFLGHYNTGTITSVNFQTNSGHEVETTKAYLCEGLNY
ncbi:hypothetical protein C1E24_20660 [Pseudoalteromonas phenolica]|uniref:Uncharacterized protein n=1 Tax=Pseudoalteromonas phenolica TaxID=161398 RepID=A0A5R9PXS6_9GAMM|nr:hypothetical protein [Pseudoalteromonas phenolica]TLX45106.1 hypothetical protein C1E24_20660 [Pseudoalteromonas phenolica]